MSSIRRRSVHGEDAAVMILGVSFAAARKSTNVFSQGTGNLITAFARPA
jgi:hypothetical protein